MIKALAALGLLAAGAMIKEVAEWVAARLRERHESTREHEQGRDTRREIRREAALDELAGTIDDPFEVVSRMRIWLMYFDPASDDRTNPYAWWSNGRDSFRPLFTCWDRTEFLIESEPGRIGDLVRRTMQLFSMLEGVFRFPLPPLEDVRSGKWVQPQPDVSKAVNLLAELENVMNEARRAARKTLAS